MLLHRAFFQKTVSPGLWQLWYSRHPFEDAQKRTDWWWFLGMLVVELLATILPHERGPFGFQVVHITLYVVVGFMGFLWVFGMTRNPIRKFISDCKKLEVYIAKPGLAGEDELRTRVEEKLILLAQEVVVNTRGDEFLDGGAARTRFSTAFDLFRFGFGLCEETWSRYFEIANRRVKVTHLVAS